MERRSIKDQELKNSFNLPELNLVCEERLEAKSIYNDNFLLQCTNTYLTELIIVGCSVFDTNQLHLLRNLKVLVLEDSNFITDEHMESLEPFKTVEELNF